MPTPARVATPKKKPAPTEPESDVEVISVDEEAETFTARLFGTDEIFTFHSDVNFLLLLIAYGGEGEDLAQLSTLMKGLFWVEEDSDEARRATWTRFVNILSAQRKMSGERSMRFINDLVAAAGKETAEPADD